MSLPEQSIILKEESPDNVYFIAQGQCDIQIHDHMRNKKIQNTLDQGEIFGEVALIFSCQRTATVKSQNYSTLAFLTQKTFLELWDYSSDTFFSIKDKALNYKDPWILFKKELLAQIHYFKNFIYREGFLATVQFYMLESVA